MFYDKFLKLCDQMGKKPKDVAKELGVKTSTLSMWKTKGVTPNTSTLMKLAEYFDVSLVDLLDSDKNSEEYKLGFKAGLIDATTIYKNTQKQEPHPKPLNLAEAKTFYPITKTDDELIKLGGFDALAEFYTLPEDAKQEALKDIQAFIEFTIAKHKKQRQSASADQDEQN